MAAAEAPAQGADRRPVTSRRLVILGGGEHARVVAEAATAAGWEALGYTDAGDAPRAPAMPVPRLGTDADLASRADLGGAEAPALVLGFGGPPEARRRAVTTLGDDVEWATVIHPRAWVSPSAAVEAGTVVLAGAVVNAGSRLGPHAIVNSGAVVEHDVVVGAHAHLAPGATVGGGTTIGEDAFVGLGASVRDHVTVGRGAVVAMGAAVVADVPAGSTVSGVPARPQDAGGDRG